MVTRVSAERPASDQRVLLLAPTSRDGRATHGLLESSGIACKVCASLEHLCAEAVAGAATVIVPEELVLCDESYRLARYLRQQAVWSDLPVLVLTRSGAESAAVERAMATLGNVSLIERPMRVSTLLSVVRAALRARERQYQVRDHLESRMRAEAALRESEERFRSVLENSLDAAYRRDLRTDAYDYLSPVIEQVMGIRPEKLKTMPVETLLERIHPDDRERVREAIREGIRARRGRIEYRFRTTGGAYKWMSDHFTVQTDADGTPLFRSGIVRDVTEQKRAEEALRQATLEAQRASEAKSNFLATLSHELRTPLTPVLLTVSLMESNPALPETMREDVAAIRRNVELESQLISDLLDLTRIERGKLQLDEQDVDLHFIVRSAIDICQREASARLVVDLKAQQHTVRGDGTRLQQVFWNLISNAIKFTGPDGAITVRSSSAPEGRIRVEVSDTGQGIDPAVLPRLFAAFEQGESRARRQLAGLGLGLTISKKLAEAHGGTITASSEGRGRGATFVVELPTVATATMPAPAARPPRPANVPEGRRLSVLLVEDHEATLAVMTKLLRGLGHYVAGATSVAAATAAARQRGFDLIISDLGLPDGSGLDVIRQLRESYAGRAIALTGYGMESDIVASREAGFTEHLTKPVDFTALEAAIHRVMDAS